MNKAKVFIKGPPYYDMTKTTFERLGGGKYEVTKDFDAADIICWTGGEDIHPAIYGEKPLNGTYYDKRRDISDLECVDKAVKQKKFLVGICRGAQLLNCVPNGGKLWQDVDGHSGVHPVFDCLTGTWKVTNSVHHQMMIPGEFAELLAWAKTCNHRWSDGKEWKKPKTDNPLERDKDVEALWYPATQSLLVQFHPEFSHPPTTEYFWSLMDAYFWGRQAKLEATG